MKFLRKLIKLSSIAPISHPFSRRACCIGAGAFAVAIGIGAFASNYRADAHSPNAGSLGTAHREATGIAASTVLQPAGRPTQAGLNCYLGNLHAHCSLSGDFSPGIRRAQLASLLQGGSPAGIQAGLQLANGPLAAFQHAATKANIDFLALTDHLHGGASAATSDESMPVGGYALTRAAADQINADPAFTGKFLAIPGMEWSSISTGNHINVFFANKEVPRTIDNGDFVTLRNRYLQNPDYEKDNPRLVVQMNHPNQMGVDQGYGRRQFAAGDAGSRAFVSDFRSVYSGIEHINNHNQGNNNAAEQNDHRDGDSLERHYEQALNLGLRVMPVGDHDSHRGNWGRHTAARTGLWMSALTPEGFASAYRERRGFATEDNEMTVLFLAGSRWMGEVIRVGPTSREQTFTIRVDQMPDTQTGAVQDEGPYVVELWGDEDGVGGELARPRQVRIGEQSKLLFEVRQGETVRFTRRVAPGSYYYLHVKERGGQDAGGENADAWTAPVFFVR